MVLPKLASQPIKTSKGVRKKTCPRKGLLLDAEASFCRFMLSLIYWQHSDSSAQFVKPVTDERLIMRIFTSFVSIEKNLADFRCRLVLSHFKLMTLDL